MKSTLEMIAELKAPPLTPEQMEVAPIFNPQWSYFNNALGMTMDVMGEATKVIGKQREAMEAQRGLIAQQQEQIERLKRLNDPPDPVVVLVILLLLGAGWVFASVLYVGEFGVDTGAVVLLVFGSIWAALVAVASVQLVLARRKTNSNWPWPIR